MLSLKESLAVLVVVLATAGATFVVSQPLHKRQFEREFYSMTNVKWKEFTNAKDTCEKITKERCVAIGGFAPQKYVEQDPIINGLKDSI